MLLLIEDNSEQLQRFAAVVHALDPALPLRLWRHAQAMLREAGSLVNTGEA